MAITIQTRSITAPNAPTVPADFMRMVGDVIVFNSTNTKVGVFRKNSGDNNYANFYTESGLGPAVYTGPSVRLNYPSFRDTVFLAYQTTVYFIDWNGSNWVYTSPNTVGGTSGGMTDSDVSPDGQHLAAVTGSEVRIWNISTTRDSPTVIHQAFFSVSHVRYSPDGQYLLLTGDAGIVILKRSGTTYTTVYNPGVTSYGTKLPQWRADSQQFLVCSASGFYIHNVTGVDTFVPDTTGGYRGVAGSAGSEQYAGSKAVYVMDGAAIISASDTSTTLKYYDVTGTTITEVTPENPITTPTGGVKHLHSTVNGGMFTLGYVNAPYIAVYEAEEPAVSVTAPLKAPKGQTAGYVAPPVLINSDMTGPKAALGDDSIVALDVDGNLAAVAPKGTVFAEIIVPIGEVLVEEPFIINAAAIEVSQLGSTLVQAEPSYQAITGALTGRKPRMLGYFTQGRGILGDLSSRKPVVAASVKVPYGVIVDINAPKPIVNGEADVPYLTVEGDLTGFAPVADGTLEKLFGVRANLMAPKAVLEATGGHPLTIDDSDLVAPKPVTNALLAQPVEIDTADLVAPKPVADFNVEVLRADFTGDLSARLPVADGDLYHPFIIDTDIVGLKPVLDGLYKENMTVNGAGIAPKARVAGDIGNFYILPANLTAPKSMLTGSFRRELRIDAQTHAPKATFAGQFRTYYTIENGDMRAPKARLTGELSRYNAIRADLSAPLPVTDIDLRLDYRMTGALAAPKAESDFNVAVKMGMAGELTAPTAVSDADLRVYWPVNGALTAPKALIIGDLELHPVFSGDLVAPRARIDGLVGDASGINGVLTAPKAITNGELALLFTAAGELTAPKAVFDAQVKITIKVEEGVGAAPMPVTDGILSLGAGLTGDLTAPKPGLSGQLRAVNQVTGDLMAPKSATDGDLRVYYPIDGELVAPKPVSDGLVRVYYAINGDVTAPVAVGDGELYLRNLVNGDMIAPKAMSDGLLKSTNKLEGAMTAPLPGTDGQLHLSYHVNGALTAPKAVFNAALGLDMDMTVEPSEMVAPRARVSGLLYNIQPLRRRSITII